MCKRYLIGAFALLACNSANAIDFDYGEPFRDKSPSHVHMTDDSILITNNRTKDEYDESYGTIRRIQGGVEFTITSTSNTQDATQDFITISMNNDYEWEVGVDDVVVHTDNKTVLMLSVDEGSTKEVHRTDVHHNEKILKGKELDQRNLVVAACVLCLAFFFILGVIV